MVSKFMSSLKLSMTCIIYFLQNLTAEVAHAQNTHCSVRGTDIGSM